MKFRTDFVTNSSSSGFVVINIRSKKLSALFEELGLKLSLLKEIERQYSGENGCPYAITESTADTVCSLLQEMIKMEMFDEGFENCEETAEAVLLHLIDRIEQFQEEIDKEADADIESGAAISDSGGPDFSYACLHVVKGKGTYVSYSVEDDCRGDYDNPSELFIWAKSHRYYQSGPDGGYADELYFLPPYRELALSYPDARRVEISKPADSEDTCEDLTFVITGKVYSFQNREEFKDYVESQGGHVAGSVSAKTDYLVNNDPKSTSSKNKKAKQLGIPIISEAEFVERFGKPE